MSRLLLVEDDKMISELAKTLLTRNGHQVFIAHDGQEAIEMAKRLQPHLVILDIMMPRMDGFQTLSILRSDWRTKRIPVIMLSGKNDMNVIMRCKKEGVHDYILKPFTPDLFLSRVEKALEGNWLQDSGETTSPQDSFAPHKAP